MYLLYLDESENSNKNRKSPIDLSVFGLSGILITSRYITNFIDGFLEIKKEHKIPKDWEIHTFEIFSGTGKWSKKFSDNERRRICKEFASLIANKNRLKQAWFCHKNSKFEKKDYIDSLDSILKKYTACIGKDRGSGKQLLVIFDQKDNFEKEINKFILEQRNKINTNNKNTGKMCRIIDHGFSGDSRLSELLQLADFVGYVFRLPKTLRREDNLFSKKQDQRFINFVDELVKVMKDKVKEIKIVEKTSKC
jgi:hypothetical protein